MLLAIMDLKTYWWGYWTLSVLCTLCTTLSMLII